MRKAWRYLASVVSLIVVSNAQTTHIAGSSPAEYNILSRVENVDQSICNGGLVLTFHRNGGAIEQNHAYWSIRGGLRDGSLRQAYVHKEESVTEPRGPVDHPGD